MKINKVFAYLLASALIVGCSDDSESWNSGSATVSMGQEELSLKENKGLFNIPIVVDGTQTGAIKVTVEVTETGEEPAKDDVNYLVTSKTIIIPADATSGKIEISTVDDPDINPTRTFNVTITEVKGATIGTNKTTLVSLRDNDAEFYEKLQGKWKMTWVVVNDKGEKEEKSWNMTIAGYDEEEEGYNKILYAYGVMGYDWAYLTLEYHYDIETKTGGLKILLGEMVADMVNFGAAVGVCDVYSGTVVNGNQMSFSGSIPGTWNETFTEVTFSSDTQLWGFLAPTGTTTMNGYSWFSIKTGIVFKR